MPRQGPKRGPGCVWQGVWLHTTPYQTPGNGSWAFFLKEKSWPLLHLPALLPLALLAPSGSKTNSTSQGVLPVVGCKGWQKRCTKQRSLHRNISRATAGLGTLPTSNLFRPALSRPLTLALSAKVSCKDQTQAYKLRAFRLLSLTP